VLLDDRGVPRLFNRRGRRMNTRREIAEESPTSKANSCILLQHAPPISAVIGECVASYEIVYLDFLSAEHAEGNARRKPQRKAQPW